MAGSHIDYEPGVPTKQITLRSVLPEVFLVLLMGLPSLCLLLFGKPHVRGYHCNDESLKYPYLENTFPTALMAFLGFAIAFIVIILCEIARAVYWEAPTREPPVPYRPIVHYFGKKKIHRVFVRLYKYLGYFILGAGFSMMFVDISKYTSGRLRPHFFEICKPRPIGVPACLSSEENRFIAEYECMGTDAHKLKEVHLSFYSGHASFAFYTAMFIMLYLHARIRPCSPRLRPVLLPVVQFLFFVLAMYTAILNVTENKHHTSDVVLGAFMGNIIALLLCIFIVKLWKCDTYTSNGTTMMMKTPLTHTIAEHV